MANGPMDQKISTYTNPRLKLTHDILGCRGKALDIPDSITVSVNVGIGIIQGKSDVVAGRRSLSVEVSVHVLDL